MDFTVLQNIIDLSEAKNLTEAAETMHISQSALSSMLRALEIELGCKLFDRKKRIQLNANGRIFVQTAKALLQIQEDTRAAITDSCTASGTIHIGVQYANDGLMYLISQLRIVFPHVSFHLHSMKGSLEDFINSNLDFYVLSADTAEGLHQLKLAVFHSVYAIVSESHPYAERKILSLPELKEQKFVFGLEENGEPEATYTYCLNAGFQPDVIFFCEDITIQLNLVRQGGLVLLTHNTFRQFRNSLRGLREIKVECEDTSYTPVIFSWKNNHHNPLARHIISYLVKAFPDGRIRPV